MVESAWLGARINGGIGLFAAVMEAPRREDRSGLPYSVTG